MSLRAECKERLAIFLWQQNGSAARSECIEHVRAATKANARTIRRAHQALIDLGLCASTRLGAHAPWALTVEGVAAAEQWAKADGITNKPGTHVKVIRRKNATPTARSASKRPALRVVPRSLTEDVSHGGVEIAKPKRGGSA